MANGRGLMNFLVLTIFPGMFTSFWEYGIVKRAIAQGKISAQALCIRDFAEGKHRVTDDRPYGGGCGMVMKPEPLARAIRAAKKQSPNSKTVLLSPQGRVFDQSMAWDLASAEGLTLVCGRYEGVDERIVTDYIDSEISIGDFILTGGELAAMVVIDAVIRLIPGTLGGADSAAMDSFSDNLLEHAHFTRPREFESSTVPEVLLTGNHQEIENWRRESALIRTFLKRPDLLAKRKLNKLESETLKKWRNEIEKLLRAEA
jgi:tRNA (guanine37-N1)-methyltransferase